MEINENKKSRPSLTKSLDTRYKMIIPAEVESKIKYICKNIWDTEWSGILFYSYSGNFEDKSLTIKCKDIFIMDIGTEGSTEFDMTPDDIKNYYSNGNEFSYQGEIYILDQVDQDKTLTLYSPSTEEYIKVRNAKYGTVHSAEAEDRKGDCMKMTGLFAGISKDYVTNKFLLTVRVNEDIAAGYVHP